ncbi:uncharacterized protein PgNI_04789 [Pyricularia grisea]|uniref:C2H2-type domain-containing protein n=1 Tax=Pyricularia grisea TaxID=148305 RepID=A0A6P8B9S7_PYRGI|nr:uncharacterized protein PgNI_04789 [Pyricularia grisea]TLD12574.1 hypothetical protein PgNI_04789 [Pyricularia grisea]
MQLVQVPLDSASQMQVHEQKSWEGTFAKSPARKSSAKSEMAMLPASLDVTDCFSTCKAGDNMPSREDKPEAHHERLLSIPAQGSLSATMSMARILTEDLVSRVVTQFSILTVSPRADHRAPSSEWKTEQSQGTSPDPISTRKQAQVGEMNENNDKEEDEDRRGDKSIEPPRRESSKILRGKKLACPYYKYDTHRYDRRSVTHGSCCGPGWPSIHRLKEHLYRKHQIVNSCNRCCQSFTSSNDLYAHMVAPEPCRVIKRDPTEGFTQDKKERIESVGRYKGGTSKPEDNRYHWREIYRILFPEVAPEDIPSPYYEEADDHQTPAGGCRPILSSPNERRNTLQLTSDSSNDEHDVDQNCVEKHEDGDDQNQEETQKDADELSSIQQATVDRLMTFFFEQFNRETGVTTFKGGQGSANAGGSYIDQSEQQTDAGADDSGSGINGRRSPRRPPKRGKHDDDDDGDGDEYKPRGKRPKIDSPLARKLACPFYKRSPRRYKGQRSGKRSACCGPGWSSMHRVKEHIYRSHGLKNVCSRCFERFNDQEELDSHTRAAVWCEPHNGVMLDTITPSQEKKLKSRKKDPEAVSEAQKWVKVYREILFPDLPHDETPSPFYEDEDVKKEDQLEDYKAYLRRDLPPLVRNWLEQEVGRHLDPDEDELKRRVIEIARKLQLELFESYLKSEDPEAPGTALAEPETAPSAVPAPDLPEPATDVVAAFHQGDLVVDVPRGLDDATGPADQAVMGGEPGARPEVEDLSAIDIFDFTFDMLNWETLPDPWSTLVLGHSHTFGSLEVGRTSGGESWSSDLAQISG